MLFRSDVFLFPSLTETFGNVTLEAMASGLAVLAFDYGAAGQHIRNAHNGLVVTEGDEVAYISHAVALAADVDRARRLGVAARDAAEKLDWGTVVRSLEDVLLEAACQPPITDWAWVT